MVEIDDPVALYKSSLKDAYAQSVSEFFEDRLQQSAVDEEENKRRVAEIRTLQQSLKEVGSSSRWWQILRGVLLAAVVVCGVMAYLRFSGNNGPVNKPEAIGWTVGAILLLAIVLFKLNGVIAEIKDRIEKLKALCNEKIAAAWEQTAPFNRLFSWTDFAELVRKVLPQFALDSYFSRARLESLCRTYGFDESFNNWRSVLFAHSGTFNGNPFVLAKSLDHWMGRKTYHGSLQISWTTVEKDSQGRYQTVRHTETLRASVEKPFPEYGEEATLIYGNTAAPDLSFSRTPSSLSTAGDGMIGRWRKARAVKKLEAKARKITDGSGFTVMANRDFDAMFAATDRDNEIQFRLLFTPLAQQYMVTLLKDQEVGFGDSFAFEKTNMINRISPNHMHDLDISASPSSFFNYDLAESRSHFNAYHNHLFKAFFFTFAPIFIIAIYQQQPPATERTSADGAKESCFWEHEAILNHIGEHRFAHSDSITRNILKTESRSGAGDTQIIDVTAHGYYGVDRVDYVTMRGGDGHTHDVPVPWVEYLPITRSSKLLVSDPSMSGTAAEDESWQSHFTDRGIALDDVVFWRGIRAAQI